MIICYINFTIFGNSKNKVQSYRILVFKQIPIAQYKACAPLSSFFHSMGKTHLDRLALAR